MPCVLHEETRDLFVVHTWGESIINKHLGMRKAKFLKVKKIDFKAKIHGLKSQLYLLPSCLNLGKLFKLAVLQFQYLQN